MSKIVTIICDGCFGGVGVNLASSNIEKEISNKENALISERGWERGEVTDGHLCEHCAQNSELRQIVLLSGEFTL